MKIYKLKQDINNFQSYVYMNDTDDDLTTDINYGKTIDSWRRIDIRPEEYHGFRESGDYPCLLGTPLVSERAKNVFMEQCRNVDFQFLDVRETRSETVLYFMNVLTKLAALDPEKTVFEYYQDTLLGVENYRFKTDSAYPPLFRCYLDDAQTIYKTVFATDELKAIVESKKLKGFLFTELWDSEETKERRFDWTITKKKADYFLISGTIFVNGVGPYAGKQCILNSEQIRWLCPKLRTLKREDIKDELNKFHLATNECDLYVSIVLYNNNACIVLNPLWRDKKLDCKDNMQLPLSLRDGVNIMDSIDPFLRDLERQVQGL